MTNRQLFLQHVAQTSDAPLALEIVRAEGQYLWDASGKRYLDLIAGISVCNVGHSHPAVVGAVQRQATEYMHLMVYGEFVESPQVQYAAVLTEHLPAALDSVYFTNSGAEAIEGAMKLAKRFTARPGIAAFEKDYHGSTQGALSLIGGEYWRRAYRPLLPGVTHLKYDNDTDLDRITEGTAAVVAETVQGEAGVIAPRKEWMQRLRRRCDKTGALLILDEVQAGLGRTGSLWAFEQYDIVPDVLVLGKALGGGMPLGAFIAAGEKMGVLAREPVLGHLTTFGGHPVCCAAGMAAFGVLTGERLTEGVAAKERLFQERLRHPRIRQLRSRGLMIALRFDSFDTNKKVIDRCIERGVLTDWFLFAPESMRIAPPLTITLPEIEEACAVILEAVETV